MEVINPEALGAPKGYSNGILAPAGGRLLFVAGQIAWNTDQEIVSDDFVDQFAQALSNVVTVVEAAGGVAADIGALTIYVTDKRDYLDDLKAVGAAYRDTMGRWWPTMALVEVSALVEPRAKVEIQAQAVIAGPTP